jgi:large subunit ribosomal protein L24
MAKFHIKKDDTVMVITGESKGQQGKVLEVNSKTSRVLVEGVNLVKKHTKPNSVYPNGGIIEKEASIHISNLMLVDPKSGNPTRIGRKLADGKLQRFSKKSGEIIK